jgi:hypothetical protein
MPKLIKAGPGARLPFIFASTMERFKANGKGHHTRMNVVLKAYVEAQEH